MLLYIHTYIRPQEPTTDGFEWSSDSDEAIDRTLYFELGAYALVDAVEMKFPVGDTYKFDLYITDNEDYDEPIKTIEARKLSVLCCAHPMVANCVDGEKISKCANMLGTVLTFFTRERAALLPKSVHRVLDHPVHQGGKNRGWLCLPLYTTEEHLTH